MLKGIKLNGELTAFISLYFPSVQVTILCINFGANLCESTNLQK